MKLLSKFNLMLVALFGAGSIVIALAAYQFLMRNARAQVVQQAELMIESARSTRQYTSEELAPALEPLTEHDDRWRHDLGVLRDRQPSQPEETAEENQRRQHAGQDRSIYEIATEVHVRSNQ